MSDTTKTVAAIGVGIVIAIGIYAFIAIPNYQECRQVGHSRMYCATTHLVR